MLNLSEKQCELLLRFISENITDNIVKDKIELSEVSALGDIYNSLVDHLDGRRALHQPTCIKEELTNGQISRRRYAS